MTQNSISGGFRLMNNRFQIILISLLILAVNATGQVIPNASFEEWNNLETWGYLPGRYITFPNRHWTGWYGTNYSDLGYSGVTRESINPVDGLYYVRMEAKTVSVPIIGTLKVPGGISLSDIYHATGVKFFKEGKPRAGVAFTQRPARIIGYYKYININPSSSYYMSAVLTKWRGTKRDTIAIAENINNKTVTNWTPFELLFDYSPIQENPDTLNIIFMTSAVFKESDMDKVIPGTVLEIDNLGLIMTDFFNVDFSPIGGNPCSGGTLIFEANSHNVKANSWEWLIDGVKVGEGSRLIHQFPEVSEPTDFVLTLNGQSRIGSGTKQEIVTIYPPPRIWIEPENPEVCPGTTVILTAYGGASYYWSNGRTTQELRVTPELANITFEVLGTDIHGCTNTASSRVFNYPIIPETHVSDSFCPGTAYRFYESELTEPGTYRHTAKSRKPPYCDSVIVLTLTKKHVPELTIIADQNKVCPGSPVILTATPGFKSYNWGQSSSSNNILVVSPNVTSTYFLTAETENGCVATESYTVFVYETSHTVLSFEICDGDSIKICGKWEKKAGFYSDTLKNIHGCDSLVEITLSVKPLSSLELTASYNIVCPGSQAVLTATPGFDYYDWGTGPIESNQLTVNPINNTQYTVKAMAPNGCISEQNYTVSIHPVYDIWEEVYICPGDSASIFDNWEKTPGIYEKPFTTVNGCDSIVHVTLKVYDVAFLDLSATKHVICAGETVTLSANNAFTDYSWSVPGQNTNTREVSPSETSIYELTVTDENHCMATDRLTITVIQSETTEIPVQLCKGDSVLINNNWVKEPGVYTEILQGSQQCEGTIIYTVTHKSTPELLLEADNMKICQGGQVTITATTGWKSYQWNHGNSPGNTITITPEKSGYITLKAISDNDCLEIDSIYIEVLPVSSDQLFQSICQNDSILIFDKWEKEPGTYEKTFRNVNGCDSTVQVTLHVLPLPLIGLKSDKNNICEGNPVILTANTGFTNYTWSTGETDVSTIELTPASTKTIHITVTNSNSCRATDSIKVSVLGHEINNNSIYLCKGDSILINGHWVSEEGSYTEIIQNSDGCSGTIIHNVTINQIPELKIATSGDNVCKGDTARFTASPGWKEYSWNGLSNVGQSYSFVPGFSGFVTLQALTNEGCLRTDSIFVEVLRPQSSESKSLICANDSVLIFDDWVKNQGIYSKTYSGSNGCDSLVTVVIEVLPLPQKFELIGDGTFNDEEEGKLIVLEGSQTGIDYILLKNNELIKSVPGTGTPIEFGLFGEGIYHVIARNQTSLCYSTMGDSIQISKAEIELPENFMIYPNPATSEVFITTPDEGKLRIYNNIGQKCIEVENFNTGKLNISSLDKGLYIAVLQVYTRFFYTKMIKL